MTWWDHQTNSIWSQPWGRALAGSLKGTTLKLLPFSLEPWSTWVAEHPDTLALLPDTNFRSYQSPSDYFVAGVAFGFDVARAYRYQDMAELVVINDTLSEIPLVVHVNPETRSIHIFVRQLNDGTILNFTGDAENLIDNETGSVWDPTRGIAMDGELEGEVLREIPYIPSFDYAWRDFYPTSDFYTPPIE